MSWYSNSEDEPAAIVKNLLKSASVLLPQPSATLVGIEEADRLICDVSPYNSSFGNFDVII